MPHASTPIVLIFPAAHVCSHPYLSLLCAARSELQHARSLILERDREKRRKHLAGSTAQDRAYFTLCLTTAGGIGPPETVAYLDHIFNRSASREVPAGHSRRDAFHLGLSVLVATFSATYAKQNLTFLSCRVATFAKKK